MIADQHEMMTDRMCKAMHYKRVTTATTTTAATATVTM